MGLLHRSLLWKKKKIRVLLWNYNKKPGLVGIVGLLCNSIGVVLAMFSKHVVIIDFSEEEVLAILEVL